MTQVHQLQEKTNEFRAVVELVDKHSIRVADEYQAFKYVTARPGLKLKQGHVVRLVNVENRYEVHEILPYQEVGQVRHPKVSGLLGTPRVEIGHPEMFSVFGRTYVLDADQAHQEVQTWFFDNMEAEAAYLNSLLTGGKELPGVQLSDNLKQKLAGLGVSTENLERQAEEYRRISAAHQALQQEAAEVTQKQATLRAEILQLSADTDATTAEWKKVQGRSTRAKNELETLLNGIKEAEQERGNLRIEIEALKASLGKEQVEAQKQRVTLINAANKEAKQIRTDATKVKTEAEVESKRIRDEAAALKEVARTQAEELGARVRQLEAVLTPEIRDTRRQELAERKPYGEGDEISALKAALQNLRQGRGTTPEQLVALHVALKHAPFTVLAGPSGSGKTSLVLAYAEQMGIHVTTVAVQPGWSSVQDLHGYVNPLQSGEYRSTPFFEALGYQVRQSQSAKLRTLLQGTAVQELAERPAFLPLDLVLLDEINLSHVEYFLADYLSAFELASRSVAVTTPEEAAKLALFENDPKDDHPLAWLRHLRGQLDVPSSFLIAGTANEDDTTRGFSDKFRDRAAFMHVDAPTLETAMLKQTQSVKTGKRYVPQQTWEAWRGTQTAMGKELIEFSEQLRMANLPVSVRLFQRTARISGDAKQLLEALEVPHASQVALDLAVALGIAHKYAQLTEGRNKEAQDKRSALREALQKLLAGRQQFTFAALNWTLEE